MLQIFFAYSHKDEDFRDELENHLAMLKRQGIVGPWHDRRIGAGRDLHGEISAHLDQSQIILLLVSADFLASDYCFDVEMTRALGLHASGKARVIPVIVHPCDWQSAPFGRLRATPLDGKPISKFSNKHDAYLEIVRDIRRAAEELEPALSPMPPPVTPAPRSLPPSSTPRSSNLRVKRQFTDRDRDRFLDESFTYIANFFENSLSELAARHPELETTFRRVDANHFSGAIYRHGEKLNSCRVWRGDHMVGDIAYAAGDVGPSNTFNETLSVEDDGYTLVLRPLGMTMLGSSRDFLSQEGASEHLWALLVDRLQ